MPPKAKPKVDKAKAGKVLNDKAFGVKNKKGAQTQKALKGMSTSIIGGGKSETQLFEEQFQKKALEKKQAEEKALMASLFKTVAPKSIQQKEEDGDVDPKTIVCAFFKQGLCYKGRKCKYSHNLNLENKGKTQVINIYQDQREQKGGAKPEDEEDEDNVKNWDTKKLEQVVRAQQNKYKSQIPTEIVCKHFLQAIHDNKYGWKWVCPNGMKCHYRHCLPPGFILKKDIEKKKEEDASLLEQRIDEQIQSISFSGKTKVTQEVFTEWKARRDEIRRIQKEEELKKKVKGIKKQKQGGKMHLLSGLAMFAENPDMFQDDGEVADKDDIDYTQREYDENENKANQDEHVQDQDYNEEEEEEEQQQQEEEEEKKEDIPEEESKKEETQQEQKPEKVEEAVPEQWDQDTENQDQEKKKKKKKKKKKEGDVEIDNDVFLD